MKYYNIDFTEWELFAEKLSILQEITQQGRN
jgi:hypothetical protein